MKRRLLQIDSAMELKTNPDQIRMRCQFCGDSKRDPNKRRLYILLNTNDDTMPILYNCFNCGASGVLTPQVLRTFNIHDLALSSTLTAYNKQTIGKFNKQMGIKDNYLQLVVPTPDDSEITNKKRKYIEERLGIRLTIDELVQLKTVFGLKQFLEANGIDIITMDEKRVINLNRNYVGFLTAKNEFINFRDITGKENFRYVKYPIYPQLDNTRKFYTIPASVDILSSEPININLAEGVFDILGVYFHIMHRNTSNQIYAAVCGSAYVSVVKYFLQLGIIGSNVTINIFSDSDKTPYFYTKVKTELEPWVKTINLYYNSLSKDFGVPKDNINLYMSQIKLR